MIYTDKQWASWCTLIDRPELIEDERFLTISERTTHTDEFYAIVLDKLTSDTTESWLERLAAVQIPAGRVHTLPELM